MRKKYTFLLTILPTEEDETLRGRLQLVQSNRADTFTNMDELRQLIRQILAAKTSELYGANNTGVTAETAPDGV